MKDTMTKTIKPRTPKLFTFDIETLPITASVWGLFDQNVGLSMVQEDWAMLSYAGRFMGERKVYYGDTRDSLDIRDDKDIIAQLCALLDEADIVIGHNVRKFDMKKVRARAILHGLKPFREPKVIDTMLMARSVGAFTSNKLEYLSGHLTNEKKSSHGKFAGFALWAGVMANNPAAWDELKKYNVKDVVVTEKLYMALRPWAKGMPNLAQFYDDTDQRCPRCGSPKLWEAGTIHTTVGEYRQYTCGGCGGLSRGRSMINSKAKRQSLLSI